MGKCKEGSRKSVLASIARAWFAAPGYPSGKVSSSHSLTGKHTGPNIGCFQYYPRAAPVLLVSAPSRFGLRMDNIVSRTFDVEDDRKRGSQDRTGSQLDGEREVERVPE